MTFAGGLLTPEQIRKSDRQRLLETAQSRAFEPLSIIDKPSKNLRTLLNDLSWRMGPLASRVLSVLGADFEDAWGHNRSHLITQLEIHGEHALSEQIKTFYVAGWAYFLSGNRDGNSGRMAIVAARAALLRGVDVANSSVRDS